MTDPEQNQPADVRDMMLRYLDGTLPGDAVAQLNARLKTDLVARHDFALLLLQQVQLTEIGQQESQTAPSTSRAARPTLAVAPPRRSWREIFGGIFPFKPGFSWYQIASAAVCLALVAGIGVWFFGPTMGQPVVAEFSGTGLTVERAGKPIVARTGTWLQPGDVLRTSDNAMAAISFAPEKTRLTIHPGSELGITGMTSGKRFSLQAGKLEASVARQRPFRPMLLTTPQAAARVVGTRFTLTVTPTATRLDIAEGKVRFTRLSDGQIVPVTEGHYAVAAANYELRAQPITGRILREYWTNLPGEYFMAVLTTHRNFPDHPNGREYLDKFESPSQWGTNYGARLCGYLHPPTTGDYTFWLAAGDGGQLFLSPNDDPQYRQPIAYARADAPHEWTRIPGQQSAGITLVAGRKYYIEALQKQGVEREDHLAVAWQGPGRQREVIPGEFLSPFKPGGKERNQ